MGSQTERTLGKVVAGGLVEAVDDGVGSPTLSADELGGTTGEWDRQHNLWFQCREIKPQNF